MKFKEGDIVKYARTLFDSEKRYRFVVLEAYDMGRVKVGCLNTKLSLGSICVYDEEEFVLA